MSKNAVHESTHDFDSSSYRNQLRSELDRKKIVNPAFSLRSFARALGISAPFLSKILSGQKDLSPNTAILVAEKLGYNEEETARFCQLVQLSKTSSPKLKSVLSQGLVPNEGNKEFVSLELESFQAISDWYHYGILELSHCLKANESLDAKLAAKRLGISVTDATAAINRMARLGLLKSVRGKWVKSDAYLAVPTGKPNRALRNFHTQMIEKAKASIEEQAFDRRNISGITIPISLDKIEIAAAEISAFRKRMAKILASSRPSEVYQLNLQFFSLTPDPANEGDPTK